MIVASPTSPRRTWPEDVRGELVDVLEKVCTEAELDAVEWKARGYGTRKIADRLGIAHTTARDRLARASRKVRAEMAERAKADDGS